VIVGPTAVGKTKISVQLAKHFNTEIISADARQFYREMNIGTAKPSTEELRLVKHHFIGQLSVEQEYSAGDFEKDAIAKLEELFKIHDVVVMTGGSGLFVKAVLHGLDSFPEVSDVVEENLQAFYSSEGLHGLQNLLKDLDPGYYAKVDRNNPQRLLRALAICISAGKPYSSFRRVKPKKRNFTAINVGLIMNREDLYRRIEARVDEMIQQGLLQEAERLREFQMLNALQTVGYKELFDYLNGLNSLENSVELIKQHTRNYAKRQMTWFRKEKNMTWFSPDEVNKIISFIESKIIG